MHILIALTYYRPHYSGLTIYAERQARALAARGHRVTILTSGYSPDLPAREIQDGIEIIRPKVWFHLSKGVIMPTMAWWAWRLVSLADIVHLHVPQLDAALISLFGKMMKKPVVLTYHCDLQLPEGLIHRLANWGSNLANNVTARASDLIVTNTRDYAQNSHFLRRFLNKVIPLYPPINVQPISAVELEDFKQKYAIQPGQKIIGMVARLATEKGVEYLVQALPEILEHFPTVRVLFVGPYQNVIGEEQYARRIMPMIESLGGHWSFLGTVTETEKTALFQTSDVLVLPSLNSTESYGMVLVEAISCGTPVIASDLPGVRVPIQQTGSGLLVESGSSDSLSQAVIEILSNPDLYRGKPEMLIKQSKPETVAEQFEILYNLASDQNRLGRALMVWKNRPQDYPDYREMIAESCKEV
jgi:glycosyltransferase involved in cell wall biosynthesis